MQKVISLEELADWPADPEEYGLKAVELGELKRSLSKIEVGLSVGIEDLYAVPTTRELTHSEVRDAYERLTSNTNQPRIILARSTDPNERPGIFETHPSLFDPTHPRESFDNWLAAARKVKDSGARAVIMQFLAGKLTNFEHDYDYTQQEQVARTVQSFGGENLGFVGKSSSIFIGDYPVIGMSWGLATKIVRGDKDVCTYQYFPEEPLAVNLNHHYKTDSKSRFKQEGIDVITLKNPDRITTLPCHEDFIQVANLNMTTEIPFPHSLLYTYGQRKFEPQGLVELIWQIQEHIGKEVEIEGSLSEDRINLFQLRKYDNPIKKTTGLSQVPADRQLVNIGNSIGFNRFTGDLVASYALDQTLTADINLFWNRAIYNLTNSQRAKLGKHLIFPMYRSLKGGCEYAHSFGVAVQTITELDKQGIGAIVLDYETDPIRTLRALQAKHPGRIEILNDTAVRVRNVTVEAYKEEVQIYLN